MPKAFEGSWTIEPGSIIKGEEQFLGDHVHEVNAYSGVLFPFGFKIDNAVYNPESDNSEEDGAGFKIEFVHMESSYAGICRFVIFRLPGKGHQEVILGILGRVSLPRPGGKQDEDIVSFTAVRTPPPWDTHGA